MGNSGCNQIWLNLVLSFDSLDTTDHEVSDPCVFVYTINAHCIGVIFLRTPFRITRRICHCYVYQIPLFNRYWLRRYTLSVKQEQLHSTGNNGMQLRIHALVVLWCATEYPGVGCHCFTTCPLYGVPIFKVLNKRCSTSVVWWKHFSVFPLSNIWKINM